MKNHGVFYTNCVNVGFPSMIRWPYFYVIFYAVGQGLRRECSEGIFWYIRGTESFCALIGSSICMNDPVRPSLRHCGIIAGIPAQYKSSDLPRTNHKPTSFTFALQTWRSQAAKMSQSSPVSVNFWNEPKSYYTPFFTSFMSLKIESLRGLDEKNELRVDIHHMPIFV